MSEILEEQTRTVPPSDEARYEKKAALSITVHSWATPVVGVVMLVIGLLGGYFARPLLVASPAPPTTAASQTSGEAAGSSANQAALMEAVVAQTRHFKGDPNAPVTIIEFSDFQ